ncbi:oligosaccharide flippase family protein [Pandoraea sp.]|uniref:oligosaccharide flippase family protein n=1 Tax=Pandoraea sp. TaxID=1883445 RepID=UPI0012293F2B|nr:oligosaccharide flippase family protein [Pandoraea sp.]TAL55048.1 MAG: flippase [Pandoraea sp.]TAM19904.1 MAG: flippase [Pandoraea sp.]
MDKAIFRNFAINFTGQILPTFVSLITVPLYIRLLGVDRYGFVALTGVFVAYFGMLDLGMGIATENRVCRIQLGTSDAPIDGVFWSACWANLVTGIAGAVIMYFAGLLYVAHFSTAPPPLRRELVESLPWLAGSIPVANVGAVFAGAISGAQRFTVLNMNQTIGTFIEQLLPLGAICLLGAHLPVVIASIALVRLGTVMALGIAAVRILQIRQVLPPVFRTIRALFGYGGWIMLTTGIAMIGDTLDTVMLGMTLGARFVTYYTVPQKLVTRLNLVALSLTRTLFPRLVACEREHADQIVRTSMTFLTTLFTPLAIVCIFAIGPFLSLWIGHDLSIVSSPVGRILIVAIWVSGQSNVLRVLIQAQKNPATLAHLGLIELPFFGALLWFATSNFGITGASIVVVIRGLIDYGILLRLSHMGARRLVPSMLTHFAFLVASVLLADSLDSPALLGAVGLVMLAANVGLSFYRLASLRIMAQTLFGRLNLRKNP